MQEWRQVTREARRGGGTEAGWEVGRQAEGKKWEWTWRVAWCDGGSIGEARFQEGRKKDRD